MHIKYKVGNFYKVVLIERLDSKDEEYEYERHKILFDKSFIKDGDTVVFQIIGTSYKAIEILGQPTKKSNFKYILSNNYLRSTLLSPPSFELIDDVSCIAVNCSSCMCDQEYYVKCHIESITEDQ